MGADHPRCRRGKCRKPRHARRGDVSKCFGNDRSERFVLLQLFSVHIHERRPPGMRTIKRSGGGDMSHGTVTHVMPTARLGKTRAMGQTPSGWPRKSSWHPPHQMAVASALKAGPMRFPAGPGSGPKGRCHPVSDRQSGTTTTLCAAMLLKFQAVAVVRASHY